LYCFAYFYSSNQSLLGTQKKQASALHEKEGVAPPSIISTASVKQIQEFRKKLPSAATLVS